MEDIRHHAILHPPTSLLPWALLAALLLPSACAEEPATEGPGAAEALTEGQSESTGNALDEVRSEALREEQCQAFVQTFNKHLPKLLAHRAEPPALTAAIEARLDAAFANAEERKKTRGANRPDVDLHHPERLREFYTQRSFRPLLTAGGQLIPESELLLQTLRDAGQHGLQPHRYHLARIEPLLLDKLSDLARIESLKLELETDEVERFTKILLASDIDLGADDAKETALGLLLAPGSAVPRFAAHLEVLQESTQRAYEAVPELELLLADAWLLWARDLRHDNLNRLTPAEKEKLGKRRLPRLEEEVRQERQQHELRALAQAMESSADSMAAVQAHLSSLLPAHNQYERLLQARERYRQIVADGGWNSVTPRALRKGTNSETAKQLKKRLATEGYFQGEIDNRFDDALEAAISRYQETHQMDVSAELNKGFWSSLNTSAQDRLKQIDANLHFWRETFLAPSDYYIYINIPDFHGEVWRHGKLERRFRIVVGNRDRECNPATKELFYVNATPRQHAKLSYAEFNPYWHVPRRIEQEEYLPLIHADPEWLVKNNYEYYTENNYTVLRQLPGDHNALGRVKFIFPNEYATFMHDTPKKALFRYPVRAFSHGCMRVQDPLELAEHLLANEGKWTPDVQRDLEEMRTRRVVFSESIDVFIDYFNVRVDDQGLVHFLADPYRHIQNHITPPTPQSLRCTPKERVILSRPGTEEAGEDVGDDVLPTAGDGAAPAQGDDVLRALGAGEGSTPALDDSALRTPPSPPEPTKIAPPPDFID